MDDQRSEDLKRQMANTRSKLVDKLETLEEQIEEQIIEPAATAVSETVATVKEVVGDTADAVHSTMKSVTETFDVPAHVRKYPWQMLGASVATGFVIAHLLKPATSVVRIQSDSAPVCPQTNLGLQAESNGHSNRRNGTYPPRTATAESPTDSQPRTSDGWGKLMTEIQSVAIHALVPVCQGLMGAVLAEFLRPANPDQGNADPSRNRGRGDLSSENGQLEEWSDSNARPEPEWGGRLRSTPR